LQDEAFPNQAEVITCQSQVSYYNEYASYVISLKRIRNTHQFETYFLCFKTSFTTIVAPQYWQSKTPYLPENPDQRYTAGILPVQIP
jgi:hypothetical protein